jgi:membrane protease YdiL (CAAX protease family)
MLDTAVTPHEAETRVRPQPIAPALHTIFLLLILILWASYGAMRFSLPPSVMPHFATYLSSIIVQYLLVGSTIAGLYHRRQFIESVWGSFTQPALGRDIAIGFGTFIGAIIPVSLLGLALRFGPLHLVHRSSTLRSMAPNTLAELGLWILVSMAAGIGEEFVFRGYLQQQLTTWFGAAPRAIVVCSLLFGSLHFYQGSVGVLQTACLGAIYAIVAMRQGNLRSVMIAHFLQDVLAGTLLFLRNTSQF